jgi:Na+/proline symporter
LSCRAFIAVNGLIYLGQVAFIVVFIVVDDHKREGRHAYNVNVLSVVAVFGLVCVAFLGYGIGLLVVTRRAMNTRRKLKFYLQVPPPQS